MTQTAATWGSRASSTNCGATLDGSLLQVVDAGLCGVIFIAPYIFGGRHDLGRLVFVSLVAITAAAWFARQTLVPAARWTRTMAHAVLILAIALTALQIVPLPVVWLAKIAPRTGQLLPLWSSAADGAVHLGVWQTISLVPHETTKSLAMLLSYCLLFLVVIGRIDDQSDIERLLGWIGGSAALMAGLGLLQYAISDGRFLWFYEQAHRSAKQSLAGPFINRNHFADFLVLGLAPLVSRFLFASRAKVIDRQRTQSDLKQLFATWSIASAAVLVMLTILLTQSRGGAMALLVSGVALFAVYASRGLVDRRLVYGLVALIGVVGAALAIHGGEQVAQRLDDFTTGSLDNVDHDGIRRIIWSANIAAFKAGWLTGAGVGSHSELCPVYLSQYFTKEYTHAENGYLQIASEAGIGGLALLAATLALVSYWCVGAWRRLRDPRAVHLLGAVAAGLAASTVHSTVDFVWYIPACMTLVIILAACALRLSQLSLPSDERIASRPGFKRGHWLEITTAVMLIGAWTVHVFVGPGIAAVHWDRYLRASVAHSQLARSQESSSSTNSPETKTADESTLNEAMLNELEQVVKWDPQFARARLKLAVRYIAKFDIEQRNSENAISLNGICDAIGQSKFESSQALQSWLERAVGKNLCWLQRAADEARTAVDLCPLQGEGYIYLAQLAFLDGGDTEVAAYTNQALRVRPHNADVLFEIGREEMAAHKMEAAVLTWQTCFADSGPHQLKIINLLAGKIPATEFVARLQPDWPLLRTIWNRYREAGQMEDLTTLLQYSTEKTRAATNIPGGAPLAFVWYWQSQLFAEMGQLDQAIVCLEQAYRYDSRQYSIRCALANCLQQVGRFAEAEPHYRWCLARKPADKSLKAALVTISKARFNQRRETFVQNRN